MEMPAVLKQNLETLANGLKWDALKKSAEKISSRYKMEERNGQSLTDGRPDSIAYALSRMPATFGALSFVMEQVAALPDFAPETMIDAGAGTGGAVWAASLFFKLQKITCLERVSDMRAVGKRLTESAPDFFSTRPVWQSFDLLYDPLPEADLITAGYVLNELSERKRLNVLLKLWAAAKSVFVMVEPATPESFHQMMIYRKTLIENGAFIAAPCPHQNDCLNDWCHFGCRVARSKLHRLMKNGDAPYEDEKFCYLIACRKEHPSAAFRVLRRPVIGTGKVTLSLCTPDGITEKTFSKKDGAVYKAARKAGWADAFIPRA